MSNLSPRGKRILFPLAVGAASLLLKYWTENYWPIPEQYAMLYGARYVLLALWDAALVAGIIGLLIESTHFGHYFQDKLAEALADLEFLERLTPETLSDIGKKSYRIKNRKNVTNPHHLWQDYFDNAFDSMASLPTAPYRNDFTLDVKIEVIDPQKRAELGISGPAPISKLTKKTKYELVSPATERYTYTVRDSMEVYAVEGIPMDRFYTCKLSIDGKSVLIENGKHLITSAKDGKITAKLEYPVTFIASTNVMLETTNYEDIAGAYFSFYAIEPIKDFHFKFVCASAQDLFSEFWVDKRAKVDYKQNSAQVLQIDYLEWMNPHEGCVVVPRLK